MQLGEILFQFTKFCSFVMLVVYAVGCAHHTVYLQDVRVEAPYSSPPLFLSHEKREGEVRIAPRISVTRGQKLSGRIEGHSKVNDRGIYQLDTVVSNGTVSYFERAGVNKRTFQGTNFFWEPTNVNASLGIEYATSKRITLVGGIDYSSSSLQNYLGGNFGVGFLFQSRMIGGRVDLGVQFTLGKYKVDYAVATARGGDLDAQVQFFAKEGKEMHSGYYGAFTLNTLFENSPVQAVLQLAIHRQNLVDFASSNSFVKDYTVAQSASFFSVTPGIAVDLSPTVRLLTGIRLADETALLEADRGVLLTPFVQFEFGM